MPSDQDTHIADAVRGFDTAALVAILQGQVNVLDVARAELASRGLDLSGRWIGFRAAALQSAQDSTSTTVPDAIAERLVRDLGFAQLQPQRTGSDFREVSVWGVHQAIAEAYQAGANRAATK